MTKPVKHSLYSWQSAKRLCTRCREPKPIKGSTSAGRGVGFVCADCKAKVRGHAAA